jgi:prepilin-type N-terminal cleavage/methylation domain-containing protein
MVIGNICGTARVTRQGLHSPTAPRGFTLVELLVALVLLDIGLLALVGLGAAMSRDASGTRRLLLATTIATARVETMGSVPCATTTAGSSAPAPGITESFTDTPGPNETRLLNDSVTVITPGRIRAVIMRTRARC